MQKFADISKNSKEFQGHGWGCSYLENNSWKHYKSITPIWEDGLSPFGNTTLLVAHARSAFQDKDIVVENNMPFYDENYVFIFNGELQGVKIKENGRIGAEKIFNFIKRFDRGDMQAALKRGREIINKRTHYIRAMNIIIANKKQAFVSTEFREDETYFTLHYKQTGRGLIICSTRYSGENDWAAIKNNTVRVF